MGGESKVLKKKHPPPKEIPFTRTKIKYKEEGLPTHPPTDLHFGGVWESLGF
jgi:hypothetical protein